MVAEKVRWGQELCSDCSRAGKMGPGIMIRL